MRHPVAAQAGEAEVIGRFPVDAAVVRVLLLRDEGFRALCEEYGLARASLARFLALSDEMQRPEVAEYRSVIAELEDEILRFLRTGGLPG